MTKNEQKDFEQIKQKRDKIQFKIEEKEKELEKLKDSMKEFDTICCHKFFRVVDGYYFDIHYCALCGKELGTR